MTVSSSMSLERFQLDRLLFFGEYWGLNRDRCWVQVMLWVRVCGQQGTGKLPLVVEVERVWVVHRSTLVFLFEGTCFGFKVSVFGS